MDKANKKAFGSLLVEAGLITEEQLLEALQIQKDSGEKIGEILINMGIISQDDIIQVLEFQIGVPHINLNKVTISSEALDMVPEKIAKRHCLIPVTIENNKLVVAMNYPFNLYALDDLKFVTNMNVFPNIASISDIKNAISKYYSPFVEENSTSEEVKEIEKESLHVANSTENIKKNNPTLVINEKIEILVDDIIKEAIVNEASDIHIEPYEKYIRVRLRIDGDLKEHTKLEVESLKEIIGRIKILCNMDTDIENIPQNGVVVFSTDIIDFDLRVSSIPTIYGEKIRIHLSNNSNIIKHISKLGFSTDDLPKFNSLINEPSGLVLISGPIFSGKSTTLYSVLKNINNPSKNIISIEDPCEIKIEGITQINLDTNTGFGFANAFNSVLKQDPDLIVVSDISDATSAELAINAANTGQLVFSTIHSKDSVSAIVRLIEMGISPYTIANSVVGVVSQRLIKTICSKCSKEYTPSAMEINHLKKDFYLVETDSVKLSKGSGCKKCHNSGFKGRVGVFEVLMMSQKIKEHILNKTAPEIIKKTAIIEGLKTIKENSLDLVLSGRTTLEEVQRITSF